jgi:hypothetical protein
MLTYDILLQTELKQGIVPPRLGLWPPHLHISKVSVPPKGDQGRFRKQKICVKVRVEDRKMAVNPNGSIVVGVVADDNHIPVRGRCHGRGGGRESVWGLNVGDRSKADVRTCSGDRRGRKNNSLVLFYFKYPII